jgi:4-amino-4-deoxy-L-arabinose transferase-like glycosyltransferase
LIGVSTALRLAWAAGLGGLTNEAYYYMYATHLDWGFFDHPPMVGLVAAVGLKLVGGISPVLGLRVGFIALCAGSTWLLARLTERSFGPRAGFLAALALNMTVFYGLKAGTLAEPDGPLLFFWLLTLDRLAAALDARGRTWDWLGVGFAWGGAMLSKYYAVLLPAGALVYLLLRPEARRCLRTPGPYLAAAVGLALFAPVVVWNSGHGWASFAYQGSRAGGFHGLQPAMLVEALVGQALYLTPWVFVALMVVLVRLARRGLRDWSDAEVLLTCQAVPALGLFLGVATFQRIMAHWPMIGFVALMPMLGRDLAERLAARPERVRRALAVLTAVPVVLATLLVIHARTGLFQDVRGRLFGLVSPLADPTVDTIRWDQIAGELRRRGLLDDPHTFLFTDHWRFSAELAMATGGGSPVACYHRDARSFTFWSRPADWVGRDGVFVRVEDGLAKASYYAPWFRSVEPIATFPVVRGGVPVQTVRLYRCVDQTVPFAFGSMGPGRNPRPEPATDLEPPRLGQRPTPSTVR